MWKLQENILEKKDLAILKRFIDTTQRFTQFEKVREFEADWSRWQQCKFSTFVNSGSSANLIMLDSVKEYYKIENSSEVLVPAVTWVTNITPIIQTGLIPVFVDVNLNDLSFDYERLEQSITSKTKIIFITHLIGIPANIDRIRSIAQKHNLIILEDCCESHGAEYQGKKVGNFGQASVFSFYWGHHMTTIEGGMICTNNEGMRDLFVLKRSHGLARELPLEKHQQYKDKYPDVDFNFLFLTTGYNVRNTEFNAVLGIEQIKHLDKYIEKRKQNYHMFLDMIKPLEDRLYIFRNNGISPFCLPFIFKNNEDKDIFQSSLKKHDIELRPIIGGNLLKQPCFKQYGDSLDFPNAEAIHHHGFYIGNNQFVDSNRLGLLKKILDETVEVHTV